MNTGKGCVNNAHHEEHKTQQGSTLEFRGTRKIVKESTLALSHFQFPWNYCTTLRHRKG